jgi:hypothetical protein
VARCLAQKGPFFAILRPFFYRGAAMAYKNPLRLAKMATFLTQTRPRQQLPTYFTFVSI